MSWNYRYEVKQIGEEFAVIRKDWTDVAQYFAGYDFMGSVNWETDSDKAEMNSEDIACDIVNDLLASDEPEEEPETDPADQQMKSLQQSLDTCRSRRNDAWDLYDKFRTMENPNEGLINNAYLEYTKEQSFYEGFMMAVFAAGYTITTAVGTDECTIVKEVK